MVSTNSQTPFKIPRPVLAVARETAYNPLTIHISNENIKKRHSKYETPSFVL